jgi:2-haloacid dehalogenase
VAPVRRGARGARRSQGPRLEARDPVEHRPGAATDPELLDASIRRIGVDVDLRITVVESGSYKPARGHWDAFFSSTDADRAGHVHVAASLFHDIAPCAELGLRTVWINRLDETTDLPLAAELTDLRSLPDVLDGLVAS